MSNQKQHTAISDQDRAQSEAGVKVNQNDYNGEKCVGFHVIMKYKTFPNYIHNSAIKAPVGVCVIPRVCPVSVRGQGTMLLCKL